MKKTKILILKHFLRTSDCIKVETKKTFFRQKSLKYLEKMEQDFSLFFKTVISCLKRHVLPDIYQKYFCTFIVIL